MQDVRSRSAKATTGSGRKRKTPPDPAAPSTDLPPADGPGPFLLSAPPAPTFPADVRVPPHRGASIVDSTEYLVAPAPRRRSRTADRAGGAAKPGARKAPVKQGKSATRKPAARPKAGRAAAKPAVRASARAKLALDPVATVPVTPPTALAVSATPAPSAPAPALPVFETGAALPRGRALVRQQAGIVGRLVAWLERLVPRKRRATLPRARTRLDLPPRSVPPAPAPGETAAPAADLAQRMLLQLSDENERLRREVAALRASLRT